MRVNSSQTLANGLRTEFADQYSAIRNRQSDSRLARVMDLGISATNREHDFAYYESAPHMALWRRGDEITAKGMDSVKFNVPVYEWGRRVPWSRWDRDDDQTGSLLEVARQCGESAALLPERMFYDVIQNQTTLLPAVPLAPDGLAMFSTSTRFGVSGGNSLTGTGATQSAILTDFYTAVEQMMKFQDTEGQPLIGDAITRAPMVLIHPVGMTEAMQKAFLQKQQIGDASNGGAQSNVISDASMRVELWPSARLDDVDADDWYLFVGDMPKKPVFFLDREGVHTEEALMDDNNSDSVRSTAEEYIQWWSRSGAGISLPFGAVKTTN